MKNSIKRFLGFRLAAIIILTGMLAGVIYYCFEVHYAERDFNEDARTRINNDADILAIHLWNFDEHVVGLIGNTLLASGEIVGVRVLDEQKRVFFEKGLFAGSGFQRFSKEIRYADKSIGQLEVVFAKGLLSAHKKQIIVTSFVIVLAVIFSFLPLLQILLKRTIIKPIEILIKDIERIGKGDLDHKVKIKSNNEFGELADAFNQMTEKLQRITASRDELDFEIVERKKAEEELRRQSVVLEGINKVFREALTCETIADVARTCLDVAEKLTGSKFGLIAEINKAGRLDCIAISNPGWDACKMPESEAVLLLKDMEIHGVYGGAIKDEQSIIVNDPPSYPDSVGIPKGHPPVTSFLGVPLKQRGRPIGIIGLANNESGYHLAHQQDVESVSAAFVETLMRKRAEEALRESKRELSIRNRIAEIFLTTPDDKMYDKVLQVILDAMESKYGTLAYINEDGDRVVPSMTGEIWEKCQMLKKTVFFPRNTWGNNLWARCLKEKRTISSNGPFKVPDGHLPVGRALAVPIIHQGEVVGNFMVGDKATDYDEKDKELLETIADHTAPILHARLQRARLDKERKHAEDQVKTSLKEKEVLLREVHHRVKNNMQVIISLLRLQADNIDDEKYADLLKESQDRIKSMALIHEKFYQSDNFADIDFDEYVRSLSTELFRSYAVNPGRIALEAQIEAVSIGLDNAIPCGLIINELISNSLKHAFPEDRAGKIVVGLRSINADEIELTVSDDGTGIPDDLDFRNTESLGLHLVKVLGEYQLGGKIELDRTEGTKFHIQFKNTVHKARI